jgi:FkbM family methyltransferase
MALVIPELQGCDRSSAAEGRSACRELSYAQNMEDFHLSLAFAGQNNGTYIDIGGGHPIAGNVSFWFYERGWCGVVAEPQAMLAALHRRLRPRDILIQSAVGRDAEQVEFHQVDRLHALSTTVKRHAEAASLRGAPHRTLRVPSISLAELCRRNALTSIDFLKIDVEGAEYEVIAGADWQHFRPAVIVVESIAPDTNEPSWFPWEPILLSHGYRFALFDTLNRFYVADERRDVLDRLPKDRAAWDSVVHMYEIGRALENAQHPDHRLARQLAHAFLASLPHLPSQLIRSLLERTGERSKKNATAEDCLLDSETYRLLLGRIACGYDGGQLTDEASEQ